jgi:hypothetical protein
MNLNTLKGLNKETKHKKSTRLNWSKEILKVNRSKSRRNSCDNGTKRCRKKVRFQSSQEMKPMK